MFYIRVFDDAQVADYATAMELDRHSKYYDAGEERFFDCETDTARERRADAHNLLTAQPGICIAKCELGYTNYTMRNRREAIPEIVERLWGYIRERQPIIDSLSISDIMSIYHDCVPDSNILVSEDELREFLEKHRFSCLFCYSW